LSDATDRDPTQDPLTATDFVLGQGTPAELRAFRDRIGRDPLAAIDVAETRQLFEYLQDLRTEPSPAFAGRLDQLCRQAALRSRQRVPTPSPARFWRKDVWSPRAVMQTVLLVAAAAAFYMLLVKVDPLRREAQAEAAVPSRFVAVAESHRRAPVQIEQTPVRIVQVAEQLTESASHLSAAWDRYQAASTSRAQSADDRLLVWLEPQNELAARRWDFEVRSHTELRLAQLQQRGQLPLVDARVQELAESIRRDLSAGARLPWQDTAAAVRALLAAGARNDVVEASAVDQLLAELPHLEGPGLAEALCAVGEVAIATGSAVDEFRRHTSRLLEEVTVVDDQTWRRRPPSLLGRDTPSALLGDVCRLLAYAPALGVAAESSLFVRLLITAQLQERRALGEMRPEELAAITFGCGDLLDNEEKELVDQQLRRWSPLSLVPDFDSLYQIAWSRSPATVGYARFQLASRRLAALETPESVQGRAWLCMVLAASYRSADLGV
jgi:hypothetical protein